MSKSFLTPINLNQNQLQFPVVHPLAAAPGSPLAGQLYYSTANTAMYVYNGTSWVVTDATKASGIPTTAIAAFQSTVQGYSLSTFAAPTANLAMGGFTLSGLSTSPSASGQAAEYSWVIGRNLNTIATGTANTGNVPMGGYTLTGLATPSAAGQAAEYSWVRGLPLSTFATPTANISLGGTFTINGVPTPTTAGQVAEYSWVVGQVQSAAAGISSKPPVQCLATSNAALTGLYSIDGYTLLAGDRVLVTGQTTASANGVYNAASGAWTRTTVDGGAPGELEPGALWLVINGTSWAATQWRCSNTGTITVGTTAVTVVQFSAASTYTAGNGLTLTGTTFSANVVASGGVLVSGSGLSVDTTVVARKYSTTIGDGSSLSYIVTHNLGTQNVVMQVRQSATPFAEVECDLAATSTTQSTISFAAAPTSGQYSVTVIG